MKNGTLIFQIEYHPSLLFLCPLTHKEGLHTIAKHKYSYNSSANCKLACIIIYTRSTRTFRRNSSEERQSPHTIYKQSSSIMACPTFFILQFLLLYLVIVTVAANNNNGIVLDGSPTWNKAQWYSQVDGVMGGQSSGSLNFVEDDTIMSFTGNINLDGGGFSSVRRRFNDISGGAINLMEYSGIVVTLETTSSYNDERNSNSIAAAPLGLHLQFDDSVSNFGYASAFAIPKSQTDGEEVSVYLPLSSFDRGTRIGFQCTNNCAMDWKYVSGMDLYVLFQEGEFDVRVKSIEAVMDAQSFASPGISIQSMDEIGKLIEATIKSGGKLYDYDYKELCIAIYRSTLNTILEATVDDEDGDNEIDFNANDDDAAQLSTIQGMICQGLQRADAQSSSKVNVAWTLRYTFDAVLEEMDMKEKVQGSSSWRPDVQTAKLYTCNGVTSGSGAYVVGSLPPTQAPSVTATEIVRTMKPTTTSPLSTPMPSSSLVTIPPSEKTTTLNPPSSMPTKMIITMTTNIPNPATAFTSSPSNSPIMPMIDTTYIGTGHRFTVHHFVINKSAILRLPDR